MVPTIGASILEPIGVMHKKASLGYCWGNGKVGMGPSPSDNSTSKGAGGVEAAAIDRNHHQMPQEDRDPDGEWSKCLKDAHQTYRTS